MFLEDCGLQKLLTVFLDFGYALGLHPKKVLQGEAALTPQSWTQS